MKNKNNFDSIIVHYAEIGLKGKNRGSFEKLLINNIKIKLDGLIKSCTRDSGHITININQNTDISKIKDILSKIPGVAYFSFANKCCLDIDSFKKQAINFLKNKEYETFKIDTRRHNKNYQLKSIEINSLLGEAVIKAYDKKVKMKNPDLVLKIEISNKFAYFSSENIVGVGGLPTNSKQKVVSLISGGFDSPVAAYLMMKRGCKVVFVHFQNKNQITSSVENKIIQLIEQLSKYQIKTRLYIIPFEKIQKQIIMKVHSKLRMLIYRRFMLKIGARIAEVNKAGFLVVGDSLSQVASQTFQNLEATYNDSEKHILSPLIGLDKKDIIHLSKQIGTYDISRLPYGDCCSYFLPKHPVLRADVKLLKQNESRFNINLLVEDAVKKAKIIKINKK